MHPIIIVLFLFTHTFHVLVVRPLLAHQLIPFSLFSIGLTVSFEFCVGKVRKATPRMLILFLHFSKYGMSDAYHIANIDET